MGDHALDALYETIDFESEFAELYYDWDNTLSHEFPNREPDPLFDYDGMPTHEDLTKDMQHYSALLTSDMSLSEYSGSTLNDYIFNGVGVPLHETLNFKAKYKLKFNMMFGMINSLYEGKTLSAKQVKWMDTNWKGGTSKLIQAMSEEDIARDILDWISKIVEWINSTG